MTIQEAALKYHWIQIGEDGVPEIFLDHHSLSTFRMCEERFKLEIMNNIRPKGAPWFLDFGVLFHDMVEYFYIHKKAGTFDVDAFLVEAIKLWKEKDLDQFKETKAYQNLGGLPGFLALLALYQQFYAAEMSSMRIVGTEIGFGKGKEVFVGEFEYFNGNHHISSFMGNMDITPSKQKVRCYLSGRLDILMDDGKVIAPMDHKTVAFFKEDLSKMYDPQEGMTGYVFATNHILKTMFPEENRICNKIWMNYVQVAPTKENKAIHERFKRLPVFKTEWQLEQYRLRQLRTFEKVFDLVVNERTPDWNTMVCNNYFHNKCSYRDLHRQGSPENMLMYLKNDFQIVKAWNTETIGEERKNETSN